MITPQLHSFQKLWCEKSCGVNIINATTSLTLKLRTTGVKSTLFAPQLLKEYFKEYLMHVHKFFIV